MRDLRRVPWNDPGNEAQERMMKARAAPGRKPCPALILEFLSAREISPAALIGLAARHQVPFVSICINPFKALAGDAVPFADLIDWDLIGDTVNRRALRRICADSGVAIRSADPFMIRSEADIATAAAALESAAWLGATEVTGIVLHPDRAGVSDLMGAFCAAAAGHGLAVVHEHSPRMPLRTVREALAFQRSLGVANLRLVIDALHFFRGDNAIADLADIRSGEVTRIQLCDAPTDIPPEGGGHEAFYERMIPGEGTMPLGDFLAALPDDIDIGMEVPLWRRQAGGETATERVSTIISATRRLLATKDPRHAGAKGGELP